MFEKVGTSCSLQSDIKDLVSHVGQLREDGRSSISSSPEVHRSTELSDILVIDAVGYYDTTEKPSDARESMTREYTNSTFSIQRSDSTSNKSKPITTSSSRPNVCTFLIFPFACYPVNHQWNLPVIATEVCRLRNIPLSILLFDNALKFPRIPKQRNHTSIVFFGSNPSSC
ncbi:unnamed protein product [Mytilus coruscus]|uniref:Uncharacterized protein n=1 Tax=Mytilus coruscus TaxID=42192 RepID=A0A6J8DLH3_MYTCO|nr:unnamed protein product [Mytilus coruscus]